MFCYCIHVLIIFLYHCYRAKKFRDKIKAEGKVKKEQRKVKLTKAQEKREDYITWKKKRESRKRLSAIQKEEVKHFDRERHRQTDSAEQTEKINFIFHGSALAKASQRVRRRMPKSPGKCVSVLKDVIKKNLKSPRKRLLFHKDEVTVKKPQKERTQLI